MPAARLAVDILSWIHALALTGTNHRKLQIFTGLPRSPLLASFRLIRYDATNIPNVYPAAVHTRIMKTNEAGQHPLLKSDAKTSRIAASAPNFSTSPHVHGSQYANGRRNENITPCVSSVNRRVKNPSTAAPEKKVATSNSGGAVTRPSAIDKGQSNSKAQIGPKQMGRKA